PAMYDQHFFFFQAEDGIRDRNVTGVQTCALPISSHIPPAEKDCSQCCKSLCLTTHFFPGNRPGMRNSTAIRSCPRLRNRYWICRSEERRVGKECRCRWRVSDGKREVEREAMQDRG